MPKRKRQRLIYYHTGRYEDLTDYKRKEIEKEILRELSLNEDDVQDCRSTEYVFDETKVSLSQNRSQETFQTFNEKYPTLCDAAQMLNLSYSPESPHNVVSQVIENV